MSEHPFPPAKLIELPMKPTVAEALGLPDLLAPLEQKLDAVLAYIANQEARDRLHEVPVTMEEAALIIFGPPRSPKSLPPGYHKIRNLRAWGAVPSLHGKRVKVSDVREALPRYAQLTQQHQPRTIRLRRIH